MKQSPTPAAAPPPKPPPQLIVAVKPRPGTAPLSAPSAKPSPAAAAAAAAAALKPSKPRKPPAAAAAAAAAAPTTATATAATPPTAAAKPPAASSWAAVASKAAKPPPAAAAATAKPKTTTTTTTGRRPRTGDVVKLDLLSLALQQRERGKEQHHAHHAPKRQASAVDEDAPRTNPNALAGTGKTVVMRGKIKRRKKTATTLKKSVMRERKQAWWLEHPEVMPYPLIAHPALMSHVCVWALDPASGLQGGFLEGLDAGDVVDDEGAARPEDEQPTDAKGTNDEDEAAEVASTTTSSSASASADSTPGEAEFTDPTYDATTCHPAFFGARHVHRAESAASPVKPKHVAHAPNSSLEHEYVSQALSPQLDALVATTLTTLRKFQARAFADDPVKARARRRLVFGLREVRRSVNARKCACVVMAPNLEHASALDERVDEIIRLCRGGSSGGSGSGGATAAAAAKDGVLWEPIPVVFALSRDKLGKILHQRGGSASIVGIISADGAFETFRPLLALAARLTAFHDSTLASEARLPAHVPPTCSACGAALVGVLRRRCVECDRDLCEGCEQRAAAKKEPCRAALDKQPCHVVRVVRPRALAPPTSPLS